MPAGGAATQGTLPRNAGHVRTREQEYGEHEIGDGARGDDRNPPADALAIEGARAILRRDVALAFVGHFHVAAERHRGERPFGAVGSVAARPDDAPESDGKPQHLDAERARDPEVAELVEDDEHAQHDEEREQLLENVHHVTGAATPAGSRRNARVAARASRSASSASSSACTGRAGSRASASAQAGAMSV